MFIKSIMAKGGSRNWYMLCCNKVLRKRLFHKLKDEHFHYTKLKNLLRKYIDNLKKYRQSNLYVNEKIVNVLDKIIDNDFFGCMKNRKRFYKLVNKITSQSRSEFVYLRELYEDYKTTVMEWLNSEENLQKQLIKGHLYILELIVKPLIITYYKPIRDPKSFKVNFIQQSKWQRFNAKLRDKIIHLGYVLPLNETVESRGQLKLYPKGNCEALEFRAIMSPNQTYVKERAKYRQLGSKIKRLYSNIREKEGLYTNWMTFASSKKDSSSNGGLYAIKIDLQDAFGSIKIEKLCDIINNSHLEEDNKKTLIDHVRNQYVSLDGVVVRWNHGLIQGDYLSAHLCELYLTVIEEEIELECFRRPETFLMRYVDDYFFCSTNLADINNFEYTIKCNLPINQIKTQKSHVGNPILTFCGNEFNIQTKEVSKSYSQQSVNCHKFRFLSSDMKPKILKKKSEEYVIEKAMRYRCNSHCFDCLKINTHFNSERRLILNIGEGMVYLAFKFHFAVTSVGYCHEKYITRLLNIVNETIVHYSKRLFKNHLKNIGGLCKARLVHFKSILGTSYRAFIVVFKKKREYKKIVEYLEEQCSILRLPKWHSRIFSKFPKKFINIKIDRIAQI